MRSSQRKIVVYLSINTLLGLIPTIIALCLQMWHALSFTIIPFFFSHFIFLSFFYPRDIQNHKFLFYISIISRYTMIISSLLIPMLIYKFVPGYSQETSYYWFFASFAIILFSYILTIIYSATDKIQERKVEDATHS